MSSQKQIKKYNDQVKGSSAQQIVEFAFKEFGAKVNFASSLGEEDQVITDLIAKHAPAIEIFTLDTGRLFPETYDLLAKTQKRYPVTYRIYYPDTKSVEKMVLEKGINLFYESVENRKLCCGVRKVEPLRRALANFAAWISGLRRGQSITRAQLEIFEWDDQNQKIKISPLANWSLEQVRQYIEKNQVDVNPLHKAGFISIGCSSCTRAVKPGEDLRAGRWWWEAPESKECGLHNNPKRLKK